VSNGTTPTAVAMSGDADISNTGATTIQPNAVETAMIADNQVTPAKIESGGNNKVLVTNGSGVVAWDDLSNISGTTYTARTGLDLTGTVFSIENGGVGTTQLADGT